MPYCTIEEAWNESLNPELREFQDNKEKEFKQVSYNNSKIYDQDGESVTNDKKCVKKKKFLNLSRTYNRLPEHSGPTSRLPNSNDPNDYYNSLENNDLPINKFNNLKRMKNNLSKNNVKNKINNKNIKNKKKINKQKNKNISDIKESFSEINDVQISVRKQNQNREIVNDDNNNEKYINEIEKLKIENEKLKNIINELKNSNNVSNTKDSFLDVLIYIVTGIIIILMMENITKLVRRF
tara:strand:+ start:631 stop:1344 length:714 start_codon:yes stop_codon:yes gene_type:complete